MRTNTSSARRHVAALAATTALTLGAGAILDVAPAGADRGDLAPGAHEGVAVGFDPITVRLLVAVATCSEMYPAGTDIRSCVANIF